VIIRAGDLLSVIVSGAGSSTKALVDPQCSATSVTAQVQGGGSIVLTLAGSVLQLQAVPPLGSPRFVGSVNRQGAVVRFQGTSTGTSAALAVTC
jgi:hypothetical protein